MEINVGAYAIFGVVGFLGGVTRMAVAMAVVMLEVSNEFNFLLPIMATLALSKLVADCFGPPLFDRQIEAKHYPYLEDEPTLTMRKIRCYHVMSKNLQLLPVIVKVKDILTLLNDPMHHHNGFPVVNDLRRRNLRGVILRIHLVTILKERLFQGSDEEQYERAIKGTPTEWRMLCDTGNPKKHMLSADIFTEEELEDDVNLTIFMSRAPLSLSDECPVSLAFDLFRHENLRHLPIVDHDARVVGVLTRKDFVDVQHHAAEYDHLGRQRHYDTHSVRRAAVRADQHATLRRNMNVSRAASNLSPEVGTTLAPQPKARSVGSSLPASSGLQWVGAILEDDEGEADSAV
jgi:chloride channel 7